MASKQRGVKAGVVSVKGGVHGVVRRNRPSQTSRIVTPFNIAHVCTNHGRRLPADSRRKTRGDDAGSANVSVNRSRGRDAARHAAEQDAARRAERSSNSNASGCLAHWPAFTSPLCTPYGKQPGHEDKHADVERQSNRNASRPAPNSVSRRIDPIVYVDPTTASVSGAAPTSGRIRPDRAGGAIGTTFGPGRRVPRDRNRNNTASVNFAIDSTEASESSFEMSTAPSKPASRHSKPNSIGPSKPTSGLSANRVSGDRIRDGRSQSGKSVSGQGSRLSAERSRSGGDKLKKRSSSQTRSGNVNSRPGGDSNINATCLCATEDKKIDKNWTVNIGPPPLPDDWDDEYMDCGDSPWFWYRDAVWGCEEYDFDIDEVRRMYKEYVDAEAAARGYPKKKRAIDGEITQRQGGTEGEEVPQIDVFKTGPNFTVAWEHPNNHPFYLVVVYPPLGGAGGGRAQGPDCGPCAADPECLCSQRPIWRRLVSGNTTEVKFPGNLLKKDENHVIEVVTLDSSKTESLGSSLVVFETFLTP